MKEERTEEVSLFIAAAQYHASFGSGGGQALQIPITAQHVLCSLVPMACLSPVP